MYLHKEKVRTGWGKWGEVIIYQCPKCGHKNRMRKNWHGPKPNGGWRCVAGCGQLMKH